MEAGSIWVVDAYGCEPARLRSVERLGGVFDEVVRAMGLTPLREPVWHTFPEPGGITGFLLLSESHVACHTFPETGICTLDVHCCRPREPWAFDERLRVLLGADRVVVRALTRGDARAAGRPADVTHP